MKLFTVLAMFALFFLCANPGYAARACQCGVCPAPEPAAIPDIPPAPMVRPDPAIPVLGACSPPAACAAADHLDQATARHAPLRRVLKAVWSHRPGLLFRHR